MSNPRKRNASRRRRPFRGRFEQLEAKRVLDSTLTLAITEIMYNPLGPTKAAEEVFTDDDFEFIEFRNTGAETISVEGVLLDTSRFDFVFPAGSISMLDPGAYRLLVRNEDAFRARYGTDHEAIIAGTFDMPLPNGDDTVILKDALDMEIHNFEYEDGNGWPGRADGNGSSLEVIDVAGDYTDPDNWRNSGEYLGTPGSAGNGPINTVVVNEVLSHTDIPFKDTIELHNPTDQPINIGGWFLSDTDGEYAKFRIPDDTMIDAFGYISYNDDDFNSSMGVDPNDFSLNADEGEDVWLLAGNAAGELTHFVDHVTFGAQANGESWGRWPNAIGDLYPMTTVTIDAANSGPRVGPVVITEIMYHPLDPNLPGVTEGDLEFVEIHNPTSVGVPLENWKLRGEVDFDFPALTLGAGDTVIVVPFDPNMAEPANTFRAVYGIDTSVIMYGPYDGQLSNGGANVRLHRPDSPPMGRDDFFPRLLEDEVRYNDKAPWPELADGQGGSLHRGGNTLWGNDPASWQAALGTPGSTDIGAMVLVVTVDTLLTNDTTPGLTGTITDAAATIEVMVAGTMYTATNNGDGTWTLPDDTITAPLVDGLYDVEVTASNSGGDRSDGTTDELTVDTMAPAGSVNALATLDTTPPLSGTTEMDMAITIEVTIAGMTYPATNLGDGTWTLDDDVISPALDVGYHDVDVTMRDGAGNSATVLAFLNVTPDATPRPWRNTANFLDVDGNLTVDEQDTNALIAELNANGIQQLDPGQGGQAPFLDVSGDGLVSWLDVLIGYNHRNRIAGHPLTTGDPLDPEGPLGVMGDDAFAMQSANGDAAFPASAEPVGIDSGMNGLDLILRSNDARGQTGGAANHDVAVSMSPSRLVDTTVAGEVFATAVHDTTPTTYGHRRPDDATTSLKHWDAALNELSADGDDDVLASLLP